MGARIAPAVEAPPPLIGTLLRPWIDHLTGWLTHGAQAALIRGDDLVVTSWWRSAGRNRDVGGAQRSQHLIGLAVDIVAPDERFGDEVRDRTPLIVITEPDHEHVQLFPAGQLESFGVYDFFGL